VIDELRRKFLGAKYEKGSLWENLEAGGDPSWRMIARRSPEGS
jgi:hypothetical protein